MMRKQIIEQTLSERERLLERYCGSLPEDEAISLEQITELASQAQGQYRNFLSELWTQVRRDDTRSIDELLDKQYDHFAVDSEFREQLRSAVGEAQEVTFWEQITRSNSRDIAHLNSLVRAYLSALLAHLTIDFMEEV